MFAHKHEMKNPAHGRHGRSSKRLLDFYTTVATNPEALGELLRSPKSCAKKWGLGREELDVVMSGDAAGIYYSLSGDGVKQPGAPTGGSKKSQTEPFAEDLVVIGTGIRTVGHLTVEAIAWIRRAEKVLYLVSDPVAEAVIKKFHGRKAEPLQGFYAENRQRSESYEMMVEAALNYVRQGKMTCFAAYGHPGVYAFPTHEAIRRARAEGYRARMLPAVSAEDCLFADLGIDPATTGCQSYEATDFLLYNRSVDPTSHLILWQIGVLGHLTFKRGRYDPRGMPYLLSRLFTMYPASHPVIVYEAPIFAGVQPVMHQVPLAYLPQAPLSAISTLYVPPSQPSRTDYYAAQVLGLTR